MKKIIYVFVLTLFVACSSSDNTPENKPANNILNGLDTDPDDNSGWAIPSDEVTQGAGKDGIPSLENPDYVDPSEDNIITDSDLIIGIYKNGEAYAYPHYIMDWHEIVNEDFSDDPVTISYCPLTGTAFGWESIVGGNFSTFGVSGLLFNSNLILYDRNTDSYWSQIMQRCVHGELIGEDAISVDVVETDWLTWKTLYPNTKVLSSDTGFPRPYGNYPYGDYQTNHDFFLFTPSPLNPALPNKQRVFAIFDRHDAKVFEFSSFENGNAIKDSFGGKNYLIVGDENALTAFEIPATLNHLDFEFELSSEIQSFFKDDEGNKWTIFGTAIDGPRIGHQLTPASKVTSMWFAIAAFYPDPFIYSN